ncbi:MAG: hypothetical protein H7X93_12955, partial [Sphingomonadaceae bacterium]|nr:hypothetical protein [Sphingomonadaceae bacterium]
PIVFAANAGAPPPESVRDAATALVERPAPSTTYGPLAVTLGMAFREAIARFDCEIAFRVDVDALITGPGIPEAAAARFAADPRIGLLGACAFASEGSARDVSYPAAILRAEASRDDPLGRLLMALWIDAKAHGYCDAEHANGCVSLIHRRALDAAIAAERLGHPAFEASRLGEDILLALVVRSLGFTLGEFASEGDPLGVKWRGLPFDPPTLHAQAKSAIHSVRHFGAGWCEAEIRAWFQGARATRPAP